MFTRSIPRRGRGHGWEQVRYFVVTARKTDRQRVPKFTSRVIYWETLLHTLGFKRIPGAVNFFVIIYTGASSTEYYFVLIPGPRRRRRYCFLLRYYDRQRRQDHLDHGAGDKRTRGGGAQEMDRVWRSRGNHIKIVKLSSWKLEINHGPILYLEVPWTTDKVMNILQSR